MSSPRTTRRTRVIISDPGDEQTHLFAPESTLPPKCATCGTTRKSLCRWAAHRHFDGINQPQPRSCLLRYDQANAQVPY